MSQQIALQSRVPRIDIIGAAQAGRKAALDDIALENAPMKAELDRMEMSEDMGQLGALNEYRTKAAQGDQVGALETLDSYPELQTKLYEAMDGMPLKERVKAKKKAEAYGRAAKWVLSYPEGSPEQRQAWDTSIEVLRRDGYLDEEMYQMAKRSGPSNALLNEYVQADDFIKMYDPRARAQVDNINNQITNRDRNTESQIAERGRNTQSQIDTREERTAITRKKSLGEDGEEEDTNVSQFDMMTDPTMQGPGPDDVASSTAAAPAPKQQPPAPAVEFLRKNPKYADQFDAKYGPGAAAAILGE